MQRLTARRGVQVINLCKLYAQPAIGIALRGLLRLGTAHGVSQLQRSATQTNKIQWTSLRSCLYLLTVLKTRQFVVVLNRPGPALGIVLNPNARISAADHRLKAWYRI